MAKYVFYGIGRIDFTADDGKQIRGYNVWLGCPEQNGVGYRPKKFFLQDIAFEAFSSAFGGLAGFVPYVGKECTPVFNEYGRPYDINFSK